MSWKGLWRALGVGAMFVLAATTAVYASQKFLGGDAGYFRVLVLAAIFAGLPAFLTAFGIGRTYEPAQKTSFLQKWVVAGVALGFLVAVPAGVLGDRALAWAALIVATGLAGLLVGAVHHRVLR